MLTPLLQMPKILEGCNSKSCKLNCGTKIRRSIINKDYWNQTTDNKRKWIAVHCERRGNGENTPTTKKNVYKFKNGCGEQVQVCQRFFLSTLGKKERRDQMVRTALDSIPPGESLPTPSRRGKHSKKQPVNKDLINQHIMSFNPQVSHYRRAHAPNRLYLPSEISIRFIETLLHYGMKPLVEETHLTLPLLFGILFILNEKIPKSRGNVRCVSSTSGFMIVFSCTPNRGKCLIECHKPWSENGCFELVHNGKNNNWRKKEPLGQQEII
jgi:hypothetical protein